MAKFLDENGLLYLWQKIVGKFVAKETGKGLSTNDFTTELKNKLDGIASGAQVNVKPDWNASAGNAAEILNKPTIPTKTSQLQNDSNFITQEQVPPGAVASSTPPKMDGTAAVVGTENAFARGDHVHPSDTTKINKAGDTMSGALNMGNNKVTGLATPTEDSDATPKSYVDTAVGTKANSATTLSGYGITDAYTKLEVDGKLSSVYKPAGAVYFASLPTPSASNLGNVYSMLDAFTTDERFVASEPTPYPIGTNVVVIQVDGSYYFDILAGFVDLSGYLKTTDMVAITNQEIDTVVA